jgi:signal peptidase I
MTQNNDNLRDLPDPRFEPPRRDPYTTEPVSLPVPEPFVANEPPPMTHVAHDVATPAATAAAADETGPELPWRTLVGAARERRLHAPLGSSGEVPTSGGPPPADETAIGSLGEEPMGGVPRETPPVPPADSSEASARGPVHREAAGSTIGRIGEELFAWLKTLASAAVYATLIVTFGFQVARVEGQSMAPTLENQDRLIVNKLAYRLGQPQVGDIVMLYYPLNPDKSFVKRVIAEEGDQIRIVDGRVYRNDVPVNDDYVPEVYRSHDDYGPEVVPQGYYFVMGDHRNNSSDSRHWKFVPKKYIIGKVQLRWWPLPAARIF